MEHQRASEHSATDLITSTAEKLGIPAVFPYQRLVVHSILRTVADPASEEARPKEIVVLPTGAGKSLCFQLPAAVLPGLTLVVFPLLALIADQKRRLDELGISAAVLTGATSSRDRRLIFAGAREGEIRVLLSNPETLRTSALAQALEGLPVSHLVIDEAHCVIEWGLSFRPAYLELGKLIRALDPPRVTAFTATASPDLQEAIAGHLFPNTAWDVVSGSPDRPNIHYAVMQPPHVDHTLTWLLRGGETSANRATLFPAVRRPAIVFCPTRDESERTAGLLRQRLRDPRIRFYHAGLSRAEKTALEAWFFESAHGVLCSTSAYGMGVDKANIRTVIHRAPPQSVESYLQESGRAGRDGAPAQAILLAGMPAGSDGTAGIKTGDNQDLWGYVVTPHCRRRYLLAAMGAEGDCTGCDRCDGRSDPCRTEARLLQRILKRPFAMDVDQLPGRLALAGLERGLELPPWHRRDVAAVAKHIRRRAP
ncbi:MAG: RecQ family ATP-dependent DNA helicase [Spirochaetaceae bacterium]